MAPSRKKGGCKAAAAASARRQWKVGDLVLAKVKGFPAWPAAVSEPEKWGYSVDWKKVLVHFFGTQQIAFCNPADVESFTEEKKQSLLTKRHVKGSDFVRAVKEITESYEKLKQQDQANDPKFAEEISIGSSGNTIELPRTCKNLIGTRLDSQIESKSSHGRGEPVLLSEDASAAEQMLALRHKTHNSLARNGDCDSAAVKDMCEIATYFPQKIILPVQHSKISSRLELDWPQRSMLLCSDVGHSVDDIGDGATRRRKRIRSSGHSESDNLVSSALNLHGSDEENTSGIATVESDNNSRNEGNGVDSGSSVEHSDAVGESCEGGHELNKGLDFQISTMAKRRKRKPTRKRETSDLIDPPPKVETEGLGTKACDGCQGSQNSHETSSERPCEETGDEHLPLVKRARVRMSRDFFADEKVNASSQFVERSSKDTVISAAMQTSPSINLENANISAHDTSAAEDFNSFELSAKLRGDVVDVAPFRIDKPSDRVSPSNQLSCSPEGKAHVSELVQGCSDVSPIMNCLSSVPNPINMQCSQQNEKNQTPLNPYIVESSANNPPNCSGLDMTASWIPAQSPHQHRSQDNDSCDCSFVVLGVSSLSEKCEKFDNMTQIVQSHAVKHSPLFCSVVGIQETENMQKTENNLLKEKPGSLGKELDSDKQAHVKQNPALCATESDMIVKETEPRYETVFSHCEDVVENKEPEKSCEADEQKEQIQATNSVSVSENLSREKLSLSPDSSIRGTPHSNSVCHISTAESANVMQHNSNCSINVQFGEKNVVSNNTVKRERKVETDVIQVKKVVSSDVQFTMESFETALGSLVRTKETIGLATRLAMDLVKFGVSAKVMEILAHTLESESNLQRRVDLFFLVDSIAQGSKVLNGDAGGVYLSSIQVMLPRLLAAAAPAGATTQENRRQCLKVLRLWLERRILPESIIRRHIRELDSHSDVPACLYSRRSSRTERSLDDPVRDMEGMLVDEYGSNSTLQLRGLCMPAMLKDADEGSDSDGGDFESVTPEHESRILVEHATPSITERRTRILEDVDGELEMEDVAPPWEVGSSAITDQADNRESANCRPVSATLHQNVTPSSPPAPPSQDAQCAMSDSYSKGFECCGYPSMHGDHQAGPPRMNPPMHYQSHESSYSSRVSSSKSMPRRNGSNFHHRPYPSPHPPPLPSHQYSYTETDHHIKPRRQGPSYPHRYEESNYHDSHERMRPAPCKDRDNWRYHPLSSHGTRYHDRHKDPYQASSYSDSGRFQNHRWNQSLRAYNNRQSFHYKSHSEGPVPVGMRDQGTWHQR